MVGCIPTQASVNTDLTIQLINNSIQPPTWRVPAGEMISLHLSNQDSSSHELMILYRTTTAYNAVGIDASTYWSHTIPAGASEDVAFKAPAAAGYYEIICREALDGGPSGRLTVVNVKEVQVISR